MADLCPHCGHTVLAQETLDDGTFRRQCLKCKRFWTAESGFFQGEVMTCALCGVQQQSDPNVRSNWRMIELDKTPHYICTKHFPRDGSKTSDFKHAYVRIIRQLVARKASS